MYRDNLITDKLAPKWTSHFKERKFELKVSPIFVRPVQFDANQLKALIKEKPCQTTKELAYKMARSHVTIARQLHSLNTVQKHGTWVSCAFIEINKLSTILHCWHLHTQHLWIQETVPLSYYYRGEKIVSSGEAEKSVDESRQAENILRQALVAFTKANERHLVALAKTNLLWNPSKQSSSQCKSGCWTNHQLQRGNSVEKNPGRRCVVNMNKHAIKGLSWVVLSHPAYSPELDTLG